MARIVNVASGAARALAMGGRAVVIKLQRDADDIITLGFQQRSRHRRIDTARHGDDDPCVLGTAFNIEAVEHRSAQSCDRDGIMEPIAVMALSTNPGEVTTPRRMSESQPLI